MRKGEPVPNFVVIVTDDQGAWSRGDQMPELVTPAIDALGATGLELDGFFCASPVCSPARASLLSGRMPSAHGVHDWIRGDNHGVDTHGVHYLRDQITTPEILAEHGYICAHSGKWHLGDARTPAPGFTHWFAHRDGGGPYFGAPVISDGRERTEPNYITDAISDHAEAMLRTLTAGPAPFYLQVHYTAPHTPWTQRNHPADLLDLYRDCDFPSVPRLPAHPWFESKGGDGGELRSAMRNPLPALRGYCAALSGVDRGVARLVDVLDRSGARADTYVIFTSDNGFSCGHHGYWGKGNGTWPLNMWEPSIRVPFVINRPGAVEPGRTSRLVGAASLKPTLLELADVPAPDDPLAAGTSFARLLDSSARADEPIEDEAVVVYDEYGGTRMIRTAGHKCIVRSGGPAEFYDLVEDPGELRNLADDPAVRDVREHLEHRLGAWFAEHVTAEADAVAQPVSGKGQRAPYWAEASEGRRYV